jgi:hypothetical protein
MRFGPFDSVTALGADLKPILPNVTNGRAAKSWLQHRLPRDLSGTAAVHPLRLAELAIRPATLARIRWLAPEG